MSNISRWLNDNNKNLKETKLKPSQLVDLIKSIKEGKITGKIAKTLVDEMMKYCGFTAGAGTANNLLIEAALDHGALGAKLTGAGGGGSVFALARPTELEDMVAFLARVARENGLENSVVRKCAIARKGLTIWRC